MKIPIAANEPARRNRIVLTYNRPGRVISIERLNALSGCRALHNSRSHAIMMKLNMLLASMTFVSLVGLSAHAQDADTSTGTGANEDAGSAVQVVPNLPPPPTRIEAAQQRKGSVVVKGYSEIGVVQ